MAVDDASQTRLVQITHVFVLHCSTQNAPPRAILIPVRFLLDILWYVLIN